MRAFTFLTYPYQKYRRVQKPFEHPTWQIEYAVTAYAELFRSGRESAKFQSIAFLAPLAERPTWKAAVSVTILWEDWILGVPPSQSSIWYHRPTSRSSVLASSTSVEFADDNALVWHPSPVSVLFGPGISDIACIRYCVADSSHRDLLETEGRQQPMGWSFLLMQTLVKTRKSSYPEFADVWFAASNNFFLQVMYFLNGANNTGIFITSDGRSDLVARRIAVADSFVEIVTLEPEHV